MGDDIKLQCDDNPQEDAKFGQMPKSARLLLPESTSTKESNREAVVPID